MAGPSKAEIERLSDEVAVERLAEGKGVRLSREGRTLNGACPFHEAEAPLLEIDPKTNGWSCALGCQGGPLEWVAKAEGISRRHAAELLRTDLAPGTSKPVTRAKRSKTPKLPSVVEAGESDSVLLERVVGYYAATLRESPEAQAYLVSRGLGSSELVETFRLGYANRTLTYRLPPKHRQAGKAIREQLQRLGVLRPSGHEHFNGSVVVPFFDASGRVVQIYGRKIRRHARGKTALHVWLPGEACGLWNLAGLPHPKDVVVTGSVLDALTYWCAGQRNVTAAYGSEGIGEEHLAAFAAAGTKRVWVAYRRDSAGDRVAAKIASELNAAGIETFRVRYPKGLDGNDVARAADRPEDDLARLLRQAEWSGKGPPRVGSIPKANASSATHEGAANDTSDLVAEAGAPKPTPEPESTTPAGYARAVEDPAATTPEAEATTEEHQTTFVFEDRRWRVRGLAKNTSYSALRVNLLVAKGAAFHVDTLELYASRQRAGFLRQASEELRVDEATLKRDLGRVLLRLEGLQDEQIREALQPVRKEAEIDEADRQEALALLRDPDLLDRVLQDLGRLGLVGEETNALVAYLAVTSRKLARPLAVVVQSSSAAGKSSLMEAILDLVPEEERSSYSAMTGQSLYYLGKGDLAHKVLAIAEEEGASNVRYALKLLQSEGRLTIASTGEEAQTGRLVTQSYEVEGPVMLFLTTTSLNVDEELLNRALVLTVDEGREQTRAIHEAQRRRLTLDGLLAEADREAILKLHRNAQRLLRQLRVVNPHAERLRFVDHTPRTRRDHTKYLGLIEAIALLRQYQRPVHEVEHRGATLRYIEVTEDDIRVANRLAHRVLGRSLDELPPQTRRLLGRLLALVEEEAKRLEIPPGEVRLTRRDIRERLDLADTQLRLHLGRLVEMEYLLVHRGGPGRRYAYELAYEGEGNDGGVFLAGLVDLDAQESTGPSRPPRAPFAGGARGPQKHPKSQGPMDESTDLAGLPKTNSHAPENSVVVVEPAE